MVLKLLHLAAEPDSNTGQEYHEKLPCSITGVKWQKATAKVNELM